VRLFEFEAFIVDHGNFQFELRLDSADCLSLTPKAGEQGSCIGWIRTDSR